MYIAVTTPFRAGTLSQLQTKRKKEKKINFIDDGLDLFLFSHARSAFITYVFLFFVDVIHSMTNIYLHNCDCIVWVRRLHFVLCQFVSIFSLANNFAFNGHF